MDDSMSMSSNINYIKQNIPVEDLYICLAEEAAELAHAASKIVRALRGINPVSKTVQEIYKNLVEEYTDLFLIANHMLNLDADFGRMEGKLHEWAERIEKRQVKEKRPCPVCGTELEWHQKNGKHYCRRCDCEYALFILPPGKKYQQGDEMS